MKNLFAPLAMKVAGGIVVALLVTIGLLSWQLSDTRGKLEDKRNELASEQAAHKQTATNFRLATAEAERRQAEKVARVEAEQKAITERTVDEYQDRIAAVRERYDRLVREAGKTGSNPRPAQGVQVPQASGASAGADGGAAQDRLPPADALIATEQALQLQALIQWVREQTGVKER